MKVPEAECCPEHIHMLAAIPLHMSVSEYMGYLKSKSSLMIRPACEFEVQKWE